MASRELVGVKRGEEMIIQLYQKIIPQIDMTA
jgi:hypothetical protein